MRGVPCKGVNENYVFIILFTINIIIYNGVRYRSKNRLKVLSNEN
jgi:hypothetical protein